MFSFLFRGQRVDIYGQKGRHFDTCAAYRALCERTNTKPEPISTNRAAVKGLLHERDRLRVAFGFRTLKNVPSTFPITSLPLITPVAHALPSDGACDPNPVEQQHSPSGSTAVPPLTLSPFSSTTSSRVLTPTEQIDLQNNYSWPLMSDPSSLAPITQSDSHDLDVSFSAYLPQNHARVSEWSSVLNLATPMGPSISLSTDELGANSNLLVANSAPGRKQITSHGILAHLGTVDLGVHAGIFQEEVAVDDEQPKQVMDGGGPFLSPGEGLLELQSPGPFPLHVAQ